MLLEPLIQRTLRQPKYPVKPDDSVPMLQRFLFPQLLIQHMTEYLYQYLSINMPYDIYFTHVQLLSYSPIPSPLHRQYIPPPGRIARRQLSLFHLPGRIIETLQANPDHIPAIFGI